MTTENHSAEERFDRIRRMTGLIVGPLLFLLIYLLPAPQLSEVAHSLAAIAVLVVTLWMTEALPLSITGLLIPLLIIFFGVAPASKAFAPFADPIMFLFIGAFILARSIQMHGLDRRFAYAVLTHPLVGESPTRILFAFGAVCTVTSMWISNTATVAMMFPIGLAIIRMLEQKEGEIVRTKYAAGMMLICAFGASIGGLATPVGTPTNLIGLGFIEKELHVQIPFFRWMLFAVPIVVIMYLLLFAYLNHFCSIGKHRIHGMRTLLREEREKLGSLSQAEKNSLYAFGLTVFLWILPGILALTIGDMHPVTRAYNKRVPESAAALIGALSLFFLPIEKGKKKFTMSLSEAVNIDWGVLAMYGGGITLGHMVFETKLAEMLAADLPRYIPTEGLGLVAFSSAIATIVSELTSNVSSANIVVPLVIVLGNHAGLTAAIAATMASTLGFMLPISTPTNAIVYSSGYVPLRTMVKYGILLDLIGFCVIVLFTHFLL